MVSTAPRHRNAVRAKVFPLVIRVGYERLLTSKTRRVMNVDEIKKMLKAKQDVEGEAESKNPA